MCAFYCIACSLTLLIRSIQRAGCYLWMFLPDSTGPPGRLQTQDNISAIHFSTSFSFACFLLATNVRPVPGPKLVSTAIYLDCVNWSWTWTQLIATELEQTDMKSLQAQFPVHYPWRDHPTALQVPLLCQTLVRCPIRMCQGIRSWVALELAHYHVCDRFHKEERCWSHWAGLQRRLCFQHHLAHAWHSLTQHSVD